MPAVKASADELQNLIAFLSGLTGVKPQTAAAPRSPAPGGVDFSAILNPKPGDWLTYNGNLSGNRYSPLAQINASNVNKLALKWTFSIPLWTQFLPDTPYFRENMRYFGLETVPLVAAGIMYVTGPNQAFALDARTGQQIWHYSRPRTPGLVSDPSLGTNRGVALLGDNVFMVTDNAHLIALNRVTGRLVWEAVMPDDALKEVLLGVFEASLDAQLRAIRRLRHGEAPGATPRRRKGRSQVDMAYDVLKKARGPLHVSEILARIQAGVGVTVDRESLVSSLTKKVARSDRFVNS